MSKISKTADITRKSMNSMRAAYSQIPPVLPKTPSQGLNGSFSRNDYSSVVFPRTSAIPENIRRCRDREEVLSQIASDPFTADAFFSLNREQQEAFLSFCMGNRGLRITYDPFFKNIFSPELHPGRLDLLLSAIMGQKVSVKSVLSPNRILLSEESSLMLMDILVETQDGALVNVEMQKLGYRFPVERAFCYASDIMVRQYDRLKSRLGRDFSYNDLKPVYVIVLMEESPAEFGQAQGGYVHRSSMGFDTGLRLNDLTRFIFISLDYFLNMRHNHTVEKPLDAWLLLLSSDLPGDVYRVLGDDPVFGEIYRDIVNFQFHPKELIGMYSETLRLMDQNMIQFMIGEQKELLAEQTEKIEKQAEKIETQTEKIQAQTEKIEAQEKTISEQAALIAELRKKLEKDGSAAEQP